MLVQYACHIWFLVGCDVDVYEKKRVKNGGRAAMHQHQAGVQSGAVANRKAGVG